MQYIEFRKSFQNYILFSKKDIEKRWPKFNKMNLIYWQNKAYIHRLRNNLYCFTDININQNTLYNIANKIYRPSYISLNSALSFYGFIPEAVFLTISITTLKTNTFNNKLGDFVYKSIKNKAFFGYKIVNIQNTKFNIADPEKAILDYLYINPNIKSEDDFIASRLNKHLVKELIDFEKMNHYAELFASKTLIRKIKTLKKYVNA